jgi:hypothetical protein
MLPGSFVRRLRRRAASDKVPHQRNRSHNQQGVDEAAGDVKHHEAEDPAHDKHNKQGEKHDDLARPALLKILFISTVRH